MRRLAIAIGLVLTVGTAEAKPKTCTWDKAPAYAEIPSERLRDLAPGDGGPVSAVYDAKAGTVSFVRTFDDTAVGASVTLPAKPPNARVLAFERAGTGYVAIVGPGPGALAPKEAAATKDKPVRYLVRHDGKAGITREIPADVGEIRALVPTGSTTVIVDATAARAFDGEMKLVGVASSGTDLGPAGRIGGDMSTLVAIVDVGEDDKSKLRVFDAKAGTWLETKSKLPEAPSALVPFGKGALVVAIVPQKNRTSILQAALVKADGALGKWIKWQVIPASQWIDGSTLAVQRAPGGDVFVQWASQMTSGMGRDDTPHFLGAQVQSDGKLGPLPKAIDDGLQVGAAVATDDALYVAPSVFNKTHPLYRWSCK